MPTWRKVTLFVCLYWKIFIVHLASKYGLSMSKVKLPEMKVFRAIQSEPIESNRVCQSNKRSLTQSLSSISFLFFRILSVVKSANEHNEKETRFQSTQVNMNMCKRKQTPPQRKEIKWKNENKHHHGENKPWVRWGNIYYKLEYTYIS